MEPNLKKKYFDQVVPAMMELFSYTNQMQVPRIQKIVLNQGLGAAVADKKLIEYAIEEMSTIAGQRAVATKSKKDISNFKLRKGMPIGVRVTLRGERMYEFFSTHILGTGFFVGHDAVRGTHNGNAQTVFDARNLR